LQIVQELNNIHKLINQAKLDHYALYGAYRELKQNKNQDVLLVLLLKDGHNDSETKEVLAVIYNYTREKDLKEDQRGWP
jgi:hypothetical protein